MGCSTSFARKFLPRYTSQQIRFTRLWICSSGGNSLDFSFEILVSARRACTILAYPSMLYSTALSDHSWWRTSFRGCLFSSQLPCLHLLCTLQLNNLYPLLAFECVNSPYFKTKDSEHWILRLGFARILDDLWSSYLLQSFCVSSPFMLVLVSKRQQS